MTDRSDDRLIVALDVADAHQGLALTERLGDAVGFYKIGLGMLTGGGLALARELKDEHGKRVFLDMKLFDIGATVEAAVRGLARFDLDFLTVHGDPHVVRAARAGAGLGVATAAGAAAATGSDSVSATAAVTAAGWVVGTGATGSETGTAAEAVGLGADTVTAAAGRGEDFLADRASLIAADNPAGSFTAAAAAGREDDGVRGAVGAEASLPAAPAALPRMAAPRAARPAAGAPVLEGPAVACCEESGPLESEASAQATPVPKATAAPTPRAAASVPIRPTLAAAFRFVEVWVAFGGAELMENSCLWRASGSPHPANAQRQRPGNGLIRTVLSSATDPPQPWPNRFTGRRRPGKPNRPGLRRGIIRTPAVRPSCR